jgi:ParB-like chromosome segregation protein Spo0J
MSKQLLNGFPVERRKLADLCKAPWNPRRMPTDQAEALKRSVQEFGTVEPIVVNKTTGNIVGGHMRLDALQALGETETDVVVVELTEEREKVIARSANILDRRIHDLIECAKTHALIYDSGEINAYARQYLIAVTSHRLSKQQKKPQ